MFSIYSNLYSSRLWSLVGASGLSSNFSCLFFGFLLLPFRDLLLIEFVGQFQSVNSWTEIEHVGNNDNGGTKRNQIVVSRVGARLDSEGEVSPPMQHVPHIEKHQHADNLDPIRTSVFVHEWIIGVPHIEKGWLLLWFC